MFVVDCNSPISQKILEMKLARYLTKKNYDFIITDKQNVQNQNIIQIGKDIFFPFSEVQIEKYLNLTQPLQQNTYLKKEKDCREVNKNILSIIKDNNIKLLKEIEAFFEKQ